MYCNKMYSNKHGEMVCEKAQIFIDFHGNVIAEHVPDPSWEFSKFLVYMKEQGLS